MNATELRIGNLVKKIGRRGKINLPEDIVFKVQEIGFDCILCELNKNPAKEKTLPIFSCSDLSPVPLTEEWLRKFGFTLLGEDSNNWNNPEFEIYSNSNYFRIGELEGKFHWYNECEDDYYSSYFPEFKYVHQLQNFYFALTGEELELKSES